MRKIYRAFNVYKKKYGSHSLAGINFIRGACNFLNSRPERNNEGKGPIRLLMDFSEYILATKDTPVSKPATFSKKFCPDQLQGNLPPIS
jgi:hypothetical protein